MLTKVQAATVSHKVTSASTSTGKTLALNKNVLHSFPSSGSVISAHPVGLNSSAISDVKTWLDQVVFTSSYVVGADIFLQNWLERLAFSGVLLLLGFSYNYNLTKLASFKALNESVLTSVNAYFIITDRTL